jgi:hypothetical protein
MESEMEPMGGVYGGVLAKSVLELENASGDLADSRSRPLPL